MSGKLNNLYKTVRKTNIIKNILEWVRKRILIFIPDKLYLKLLFRIKMNKKLNLKDPKTFNEKLQWLKLYNKNPKYTMMADKYKVRDYVKNIIGEEYLIPLLGVYDSFDDIDFSKLPNQFVIKCNHDSGSVVICKDKNNFDIKKAEKKISKALKTNYFYKGREWQYKNIERKIIIEKYIGELADSEVLDYKLFVFNEKFAYSFVCSDRFSDLKFTFFDKNNKLIKVKQGGSNYDPKIKLPKTYDNMIELAEKLSKDTIVLRVDFYEVNGKIYFGELTFFDASGFDSFEPDYYDKIFGDMIKLPDKK